MFDATRLWQTRAMQLAASILWFLPSVVFGVGTVITIVALRRAPEGFESENGFHLRPTDAALVPVRTHAAVGTGRVELA